MEEEERERKEEEWKEAGGPRKRPAVDMLVEDCNGRERIGQQDEEEEQQEEDELMEAES